MSGTEELPDLRCCGAPRRMLQSCSETGSIPVMRHWLEASWLLPSGLSQLFLVSFLQEPNLFNYSPRPSLDAVLIIVHHAWSLCYACSRTPALTFGIYVK